MSNTREFSNESQKSIEKKIFRNNDFHIEYDTFQHEEQRFIFVACSPACYSPRANRVKTAVIYVPGDFETIKGQEENGYLQMLCNKLENHLQTSCAKNEIKIAIELTLIMMDYQGKGLNKDPEQKNYAEISVDTDAENIAALTRYIAEKNIFSPENIYIMGNQQLGSKVADLAQIKLSENPTSASLKTISYSTPDISSSLYKAFDPGLAKGRMSNIPPFNLALDIDRTETAIKDSTSEKTGSSDCFSVAQQESKKFTKKLNISSPQPKNIDNCKKPFSQLSAFFNEIRQVSALKESAKNDKGIVKIHPPKNKTQIISPS